MKRYATYALPLALAACSGAGSQPGEIQSAKQRENAPAVSSAQLTAAATGERAFGVDLYGQLAKAPGNLFFSPHSIDEALSMTYVGAAGATATQMRGALAYTLPDDQLHQAMNGLDLALESRGKGQTGVDGSPFSLRVANALWGQDGYTFLPAFLDTIALNYGAGVHPLDFVHAPEPSRVTINDWVAKETSNKILDLIPQGGVTSDTRLVLTNAVYFNASWANAFEASATTDAPFTLADGSTVQAPTMHGGLEGAGFSDASMQAVQLDYAGNELSMVIVQPKDLAAFESAFSPDRLDAIIAKLAPAYVTLSLPKWKVTDTHSLSEPLQQLGMTDAFDSAADFSGMDGARDFIIQDVLHKAYIAVDEKGTEAAAATAVVVGTTSIESNQLSLTFDHPYLYLIRDNATGAVVFMGRVSNPTK